MGIEDPEAVAHGNDQSSNSLLANTRCCFCFPCFSSGGSSTVGLAWWERIRSSSKGHTTTAEDNSYSSNRWWSKGVRAFMKIREWSEIVAGPRWKTFIRRFNNRHRGSGSRHHGKFQYDPLSYALNFDEGHNGNFDEEYDDFGGFRDFSSRYASVSSSGKPLAMAVSIRENDVAVVS